MSEVNGSLPELSTSQYVIQIEHQGTKNEQYAIKDYALTQRVQELKMRLKNYRGTIETLEEFPTTNGNDEVNEDEPIDGSYWVGGVSANHSFINSDETSATLTFPALLLANKTNQEYSLLTVDGEIWIHKCANDQEGVHLWTNKWDDYYTKAEVNELITALENKYDSKIQNLEELIRGLSEQIESLNSQIKAIGTITSGSNPLNTNILILGDNTSFSVDNADVNVAQLVQEKLNLTTYNGVIWINNSDSKKLYEYLWYSKTNFDGIKLPFQDDMGMGWISNNINSWCTSNNVDVVPFSSFSIIIYIINPGDISTGNETIGAYTKPSSLKTPVVSQTTNNDIQIPSTVSFGTNTITGIVQNNIVFIQSFMDDSAILKIVTPITWFKNGQTNLSEAISNLSDSLQSSILNVSNKEKIGYKSIYSVPNAKKATLMDSSNKIIINQGAIDNYISGLCSFIQEDKNNNVVFTPVNDKKSGTLVIKASGEEKSVSSGEQIFTTNGTNVTLSGSISQNPIGATVTGCIIQFHYKINNGSVQSITDSSPLTVNQTIEGNGQPSTIKAWWYVKATVGIKENTDNSNPRVNYPWTIQLRSD